MVRVDKTASPTQPKTEQQFLRWKCCSECKPLTKAEVSAIVELKDSFDKPMIELRQVVPTNITPEWKPEALSTTV